MVGRTLRGLAAAALACSFIAPAAGATLIGPTPYSGFAGSPFDGIPSFQLEDFEDGSLNVPGVSADTGLVLGPNSGLTDSVENAPDGCNPSGTLFGANTCTGWSYYSNGARSLTFTFSGTLPTNAGIVWTDVGSEDIGVSDGYVDVVFEAFDQDGASLGTRTGFHLGDGFVPGDGNPQPQTAEDSFFGAVNTGGISKITISIPTSTDWEVDHLQFGVVPEPGTGLLLGLGLLAFTEGRRARSRRARI